MKILILLFLILICSCKNKNSTYCKDSRIQIDTLLLPKEIDTLLAKSLTPEKIRNNIINEFTEKGYVLNDEISYKGSGIFFNRYHSNNLYDTNKIKGSISCFFKRKGHEKDNASIKFKIIEFESSFAAYEFIKATNKLLEKEPINFKGPSFYSKKDNYIYIYSTNAFMFLKYVKEMKLLCDSLVIKPDTADIRMAGECTYNIKMDTYYKTK